LDVECSILQFGVWVLNFDFAFSILDLLVLGFDFIIMDSLLVFQVVDFGIACCRFRFLYLRFHILN
jgi:hypothetical protein